VNREIFQQKLLQAPRAGDLPLRALEHVLLEIAVERFFFAVGVQAIELHGF
jgi:hypothetical protein